MNCFGPGVSLSFGDRHAVLSYAPKDGLYTPPDLLLHPMVGLILQKLDRAEPEEAIVDLIAGQLGLDPAVILELVQDTAHCFKGHFNQDRPGAYIEAVDDDVILDFSAMERVPISSRSILLIGDRTPFPLTLQWLVTRNCNRACVYCYQGAIPSKTARDEGLLEKTEIIRILDDARRLGTFMFFMTGGEPLLRDESYDILAHALQIGMEPDFLTKQFIPEHRMLQLRDNGLKTIYLSVDTLDPLSAAQLTGVRPFAARITETIRLLVNHGLRVVVQSVLTQINLEDALDSLTRFRDLGVAQMRIDAYSENLERHDPRLMLGRDDIERFAARLDQLQPQLAPMRVVFTGHRALELKGDYFVCNNSSTALLFLPDGKVSRCDKQLPGDMTIGDLRQNNVYEIWNGTRMKSLFKPAREHYRGTLCFDCDHFDSCHAKGRCFFDAMVNSQTLYGPQGRTCTYLTQAKQILC